MGKRFFAVCFAAGVAALGSAATLAQTQAPPPLVVDSMSGKDLFQFYCATCHGPDGRGKGPVGAVLKTPPADLTKIAERRGGAFPRAEIVGFVSEGPAVIPAHGTIEMPVWGPIFRDVRGNDKLRVYNLKHYIDSIQEK